MIKRLLDWFRPSLEDSNHTASYRRISVYVHLCLICYMIIAKRIRSGFELTAFEVLTGSFLLQIGIISVQNILTFFGRDKSVVTQQGNPSVVSSVSTDKITLPEPAKDPD